MALVPRSEFVEQDPLADNAYQDPAMWFSRPGIGCASRSGAVAARASRECKRRNRARCRHLDHGPPRFAVFFIHPTSFYDAPQWNAR